MLENKRIKEAEKNVRYYLEQGMLKKIQKPEPGVINILLKNSKESINAAETMLENERSFLWTIVCSYYSMYYIANAVLYSMGNKVGDKIPHKVTADALIIYAKNKLKTAIIEEYEEAKEDAIELAGLRAEEIIESFEHERSKRGNIQYSTTEVAKKAKAETSLQRAKKFIFEMNKLLD
jgi:uncharacterized protein (UPF0332 family)